MATKTAALESEMRLKNVEIIRSPSAGSKVPVKYLSLVVLVFQNASQVLLIRYARTRPKQEMFLSTSAVFFTEVIKLVACLFLVAWEEKSIIKCFHSVFDQIVLQPFDTLKVCVPSIIYTLQNNLLYIAVSNLAAATFMVTYQLKILTTALFSVIMLKKPLSKLQWISLCMLFVGVSIVQLQEQSDGKIPAVTPAPISAAFQNISSINPEALSAPRARVSESIVSIFSNLFDFFAVFVSAIMLYSRSPAQDCHRAQSPLVGLGAVIIACLLSGFAGIYFEKILKGSEVTVWMRNVQLSVLSIPIAYITMEAKDSAILREKGLLYGYDALVWTIVAVYALGGLTVAVVIKYADNILKGFATSLAIVVSCVASIYLFNVIPNLQFLGGTSIVMASIYVYSKYPYSAATKSNLSIPSQVLSTNPTSLNRR